MYLSWAVARAHDALTHFQELPFVKVTLQQPNSWIFRRWNWPICSTLSASEEESGANKKYWAINQPYKTIKERTLRILCLKWHQDVDGIGQVKAWGHGATGLPPYRRTISLASVGWINTFANHFKNLFSFHLWLFWIQQEYQVQARPSILHPWPNPKVSSPLPSFQLRLATHRENKKHK